MSMLVEVWGDYACFTRPEMKTERVSYDVMTPSAARGLVEAIYWHPGMKYHIDRIYVLNPIRFTTIRRNEVKSTLLASAAFSAGADAHSAVFHIGGGDGVGGGAAAGAVHSGGHSAASRPAFAGRTLCD